MLQAVAGYDPKDPNSQRNQIPDYRSALKEDLHGLRIGVPRHFFTEARYNTGQETLDVVNRALADLESLWARTEEVTIPSLRYAGDANMTIILSEALAYHKKNLATQPENYGWVVRQRLYLGALLTAEDYVQAQRARSRVRQELGEALRKFDLLAMPCQPGPAGAVKDFDPTKSVLTPGFTAPFDLTGLPALSVPCGFSSTGLPIGLEIAGRAFDEATVFRVVNAYQNYAKWHMKRPQV